MCSHGYFPHLLCVLHGQCADVGKIALMASGNIGKKELCGLVRWFACHKLLGMLCVYHSMLAADVQSWSWLFYLQQQVVALLHVVE
jgi:hypothetical protein